MTTFLLAHKLRIVCWLLLFSVFPAITAARTPGSIREYALELYDTERGRVIPLAVYAPGETAISTEVILFNHGYGGGDPEACRRYSYLTRELARQGFLVISIQHERPGDKPLSMEGNLYETRIPNWQQGVENMLFVQAETRKLWPTLNWAKLTVIGHSNGGDMTMLLAERHPQSLYRAITLDHRRMPIPRSGHPRLGSLRGCDYQADPGVLPSAKEARKYGIDLIRYEHITHGDMDDKGSAEKHEQICRDILYLMRKP